MADVNRGWDGPIPPPPRPIEYQNVDTSGWWLSVLGGLALVGLGVWLLTHLFESVVVLAWLVGVSLIAGGIAEAAGVREVGVRGAGGSVEALDFGDGSGARWPAWLGGGLLVAAGAVILAWPEITLSALAVVAGVGLIVSGLVWVLAALAGRDPSDRAWRLGLGALAVVVGAVVVAWPGPTLVVLAVLLGVRAVATGLLAIGLGWRLHRMSA